MDSEDYSSDENNTENAELSNESSDDEIVVLRVYPPHLESDDSSLGSSELDMPVVHSNSSDYSSNSDSEGALPARNFLSFIISNPFTDKHNSKGVTTPRKTVHTYEGFFDASVFYRELFYQYCIEEVMGSMIDKHYRRIYTENMIRKQYPPKKYLERNHEHAMANLQMFDFKHYGMTCSNVGPTGIKCTRRIIHRWSSHFCNPCTAFKLCDGTIHHTLDNFKKVCMFEKVGGICGKKITGEYPFCFNCFIDDACRTEFTDIKHSPFIKTRNPKDVLSDKYQFIKCSFRGVVDFTGLTMVALEYYSEDVNNTLQHIKCLKYLNVLFIPSGYFPYLTDLIVSQNAVNRKEMVILTAPLLTRFNLLEPGTDTFDATVDRIYIYAPNLKLHVTDVLLEKYNQLNNVATKLCQWYRHWRKRTFVKQLKDELLYEYILGETKAFIPLFAQGTFPSMQTREERGYKNIDYQTALNVYRAMIMRKKNGIFPFTIPVKEIGKVMVSEI